MNAGAEFERLHGELAEAVIACRAHSSRHAVHTLRTGTRKLESVLSKLLQDHPGAPRFHTAAYKALKELKHVRKAAGPVRDLDVHRKLAEEIRGKPAAKRKSRTSVDDDYHELDRRLRRRRERAVRKLEAVLERREVRLECAIEATAREIEHFRAASPPALATAREWVRRSPPPEMNRDDPDFEDKLHDYRKRTKAARYIAGLQPASASARRLAKRLKEVQDCIGSWHDLMLLSSEAAAILGKRSELTRAIKDVCQRALHYAAHKLRVHGRNASRPLRR